MKYRLTRRARRDILDIWQYIAQDNEAAADRFIDLLNLYIISGSWETRLTRGACVTTSEKATADSQSGSM